MENENNSIAFVIQNYIQYLNIIPGIEALIKRGYDVDLYGLVVENPDGYTELFNDVIEQMKNKGYKVYTKEQRKTYKIVFEVYECSLKLKAKYRIKYRYSQLSAKPNIVYSPDNFIMYDCVLCSGPYEARLMNNFAHTEILDDLKFSHFKKRNYKKEKPVLLYLPTYGKESSIDLILKELANLRKKYYVIAKIHHGTSFLYQEKNRISSVEHAVDECYDLHTELKDLLEIADVVLTDNSASVFDAIYTDTPVCCFSNDLNQNKLGEFNTIQYTLYQEGILPYTNDVKKIKDILKTAQSSQIRKKQHDWNMKNFYHSKNPIQDFIKLVDKYLYDKDVDVESYVLRRLVNEKINNIMHYNAELETQLDDYRKGKLYGIASKIYKWKSDLKNLKKKKRKNKELVIGYTAGVYDLFHMGHLNLLKNAKGLCDKLVVGVTVDELVKYKGKTALIPFAERAEIVRACRYVDLVVPQEDMDKIAMCKKIGATYLFVGDDWYGTDKWKDYEEEAEACGIKIIYFPYTKSISSTKIREALKHSRGWSKSEDGKSIEIKEGK